MNTVWCLLLFSAKILWCVKCQFVHLFFERPFYLMKVISNVIKSTKMVFNLIRSNWILMQPREIINNILFSDSKIKTKKILKIIAIWHLPPVLMCDSNEREKKKKYESTSSSSFNVKLVVYFKRNGWKFVF